MSNNQYLFNLGSRFKSVASQKSDSVAVLFEEQKLTYSELDRQSDAMATYFIQSGLKVGDLVCISGTKNITAVICILGALKAGVTYSVFDPESPQPRLLKIFDRCNPALVLCENQLTVSIPSDKFKVADYTKLQLPANEDDNAAVVSNHLKSITAATAAYVMFTSGSTGFPKGATMTHQNVLNLIDWSIQTYGIGAGEVFTSVNPFFFDNSVFDLYSSLFSGSTIALFDGQAVRDSRKLLRLIDEFKCTSWFSVPSMLIYLQTMRALNADSFSSLKRIIFGGEGYPKARLVELFDLLSHRISFYNVYGPTECTCICSSYRVESNDFADLKGFLPLGKLAPNFSGWIVDEALQIVPDGQQGELLLGGPNVGMGYYRDHERTNLAFVQNPTHSAYRDMAYRTGDVVLHNPDDDKIRIMGRADNQIKHMGYRIELEEIENALSCIESVAQTAVIHCELRGISQIVAFVKLKSDTEEDEIRKVLKGLLPAYMIPTKFSFVQYLQKNANGKLDRKQLKSDYLGQRVNG